MVAFPRVMSETMGSFHCICPEKVALFRYTCREITQMFLSLASNLYDSAKSNTVLTVSPSISKTPLILILEISMFHHEEHIHALACAH